MNKFELINPSVARVLDPQLRDFLMRNPIADKNDSIEYRLSRIRDNIRKATINGNSWYLNKLLKEAEELQKVLMRPITWVENGDVFIRPGYIPYLMDDIKLTVEPENGLVYLYTLPKPRPYPMAKPLKYKPYPYQQKAVELLLTMRHATIESATGTGKTIMIVMLAQKLGLKTIVVTPFVPIFEQIYEEFVYYFGSGSVGVYGGGKKKNPRANFVIAVSDSIASINPEDEKAMEYFKGFDVAIFDEAHTLSAETLEAMAFGPLAHIPYRYFFTGTHTRPDGLNNLLQAITGPVVMRYKTKDAIADGVICPFKVRVIDVESDYEGEIDKKDVMAVKRAHFLYNNNIAKAIADTIVRNVVVGDKKRSALVLVSEIRQIYLLYKALLRALQGVDVGKNVFDVMAVATSTISKEAVIKAILPDSVRKKIGRRIKSANFVNAVKNAGLLEPEDWEFVEFIEKSSIPQSIEDFNMGRKRVLVGTTAISTGVNIFPTHLTFNWQGGSSEVTCKQGAIGRSVRRLDLSPYKEYHDPKPFSLIIDFNVKGQPILYNMLKKRLQYYEE